jgi:hypothetical protein
MRMLRTIGPRRLDLVWLLVLFLMSSLWCVTAAGRLGATFDEPTYLSRGLQAWQTGTHYYLLQLGTMPLPVDVQTLPLYLAECWRGRPWDPVADFETMLFWARVANLPFWALLLVYGWRIGHSLAGPWGGRLAATVLACEPNLLAHATLASTDLALTACLLAFLFHFRAGRDSDSRFRRVVVPGIWYGVALLAKASALAFAPIGMLAIEAERWLREDAELPRRPILGRLRAFVNDFLQVGLIGFVLIFLYCGTDWIQEPSFVAWARGLPEGPARTAMVWFAENLRIFSNAGVAIARQIKHNIQGHGSYILGQTDRRAIWYYFPVLLTIKLTVPFLLALLVLAAARVRGLWSWATAAAAALAVFSLTCRVQIGIRLLLPCVALAGIGLAAALVHAVRAAEGLRRRRAWQLATSAGVTWVAAASLAAWPHGLSYINELWGGRRDGYRHVSESNYDWGQGVPELARWQRRHGVADLHVWYFGTDPTVKRLPAMTVTQFHGIPVRDGADVLQWVAGRHLAVSTTLLYGYRMNDSHRRAAEFLLTRPPAARTSTFFIYDFTREPGHAQRPEVGRPRSE